MIDYTKLPQHYRKQMKRYIEKGTLPNEFLMAIISNNLILSFSYAHSRDNIETYVSFMIHETPSLCYGSVNAMKEWAENGGLSGMTKDK